MFLDFMNFALEDGVLLAKNKHVRIAKKRWILNGCSVIRILFVKNIFFVKMFFISRKKIKSSTF